MAGLYCFVSVISMLHVIEFFELSNTRGMAIALAIAFELGAMASLCSILIMDKMKAWIVWGLFIILTIYQAAGNTYFAFAHLENYQGWIELFGLADLEIITQKRILAIVSGAILPIVALGFIKTLVDYIRPEKQETGAILANQRYDSYGLPNLQDEKSLEFLLNKPLTIGETQPIVEELVPDDLENLNTEIIPDEIIEEFKVGEKDNFAKVMDEYIEKAEMEKPLESEKQTETITKVIGNNPDVHPHIIPGIG